MSDKQRADHVQAKYWNGFITRTEAQNVFNEQTKVIQALSVTIQKLDMVVSFFADKFGITAEEINNWLKLQQEKAKVTLPPYECVCSKTKPEEEADHEEACRVFNARKRQEAQQAEKSQAEGVGAQNKLIVEA